ncbi:zinc-binding dehydrogenase [Actinokineospora spheciospongiae]|uniref:zinc-binding dehydrogenase n=1 Tax=Actinokineospora spheciospongiae TaxID=909613 RepID=UPI000D9B2BBB|nr:zinc-binding dehydrogenase [Actinokineospora spheciospongiae]PWW66495.1 NADPH:quinone reductase-like Zn-dependent oxidoreductase [Actinokineospora spheciospongiae]
MRAVRFHEFGDPGVLRLEDVADPVPAADEVLVRVEAAGTSYLDAQLRAGSAATRWFPMPGLPWGPGFQVAGAVVAAADPGLIGTRVVAGLCGGGYAELAAVPVASLVRLPPGVGVERAVALNGHGAMAVGLMETGLPAAGEVVLVLAAAGGVGGLVVQLAKRAGAVVVGAAGGPEKCATAAALGADHVVDYSRPDWADRVRALVSPVALLFDGVGGHLSATAMGLLAPGTGRAVVHGTAASDSPGFTAADVLVHGLTVTGFGPRVAHEPARAMGLRTEAMRLGVLGLLNPITAPPVPLAEAATAHRLLEARRTIGTVVLTP